METTPIEGEDKKVETTPIEEEKEAVPVVEEVKDETSPEEEFEVEADPPSTEPPVIEVKLPDTRTVEEVYILSNHQTVFCLTWEQFLQDPAEYLFKFGEYDYTDD